MRFQILLLAASLSASMLAGYAVSETPEMSPEVTCDRLGDAVPGGDREAEFIQRVSSDNRASGIGRTAAAGVQPSAEACRQ